MAKIEYRGVLCAAIWQGALFGFGTGYWLGAAEPLSHAQAAMMVAAGAVGVHTVWRRTWRHFWPEDFRRPEQ